MRITYRIATYNLGDLNTEADNEAYAAAVATRIEQMYPTATVEVDLSNDGDRDVCTIGGSRGEDAGAIEESCREAAQAVWDAADYA